MHISIFSEDHASLHEYLGVQGQPAQLPWPEKKQKSPGSKGGDFGSGRQWAVFNNCGK